MKRKQTKNGYSALGKGVFPASHADSLHHPLRRFIKSPKCVADRLFLESNHKVLEVGAGSGYYSLEVARRIADGHFTLLDIQADMLAMNMQTMEQADIQNTSSVEASASALPFNSKQFNRIFMVTVLGELDDPRLALKEMYRVAQPHAILSISEQRTDPDFLSLKEVRKWAEEVGFVFQQKFGWFWNYTVNFNKPSDVEGG